MVSSSEIRRLIESGNVSRACRLLERPFALEGDVVTGHGIGSKQTVPTLNLSTPCGGDARRTASTLPGRTTGIPGTWQSVTNIGYRPTFGGTGPGDRDVSAEPFRRRDAAQIRVEFLRRLRDEKKFDSPELLKAQILRDVRRAQAYFRRVPCHNQET